MGGAALRRDNYWPSSAEGVGRYGGLGTQVEVGAWLLCGTPEPEAGLGGAGREAALLLGFLERAWSLDLGGPFIAT